MLLVLMFRAQKNRPAQGGAISTGRSPQSSRKREAVAARRLRVGNPAQTQPVGFGVPA
jgi:hypothetical protein